jgi:hypothetical protein
MISNVNFSNAKGLSLTKDKAYEMVIAITYKHKRVFFKITFSEIEVLHTASFVAGICKLHHGDSCRSG